MLRRKLNVAAFGLGSPNRSIRQTRIADTISVDRMHPLLLRRSTDLFNSVALSLGRREFAQQFELADRDLEGGGCGSGLFNRHNRLRRPRCDSVSSSKG